MSLFEYMFGFFIGAVAAFELQILWFRYTHRLYSPLDTFDKIVRWLAGKKESEKK